MGCIFRESEAIVLETNFSENECIPKHVAIIMDGNRRYAKNNHMTNLQGHWKGAETLIEIVKAAKDIGIKILTVFGFSTENWERSDEEIEAFFQVLSGFLISQRLPMIRDGIRLQFIGNINLFPPYLCEMLKETEQFTKEGSNITLVLALSYGGRDELMRSFKNLLLDYDKNKFTLDSIYESLIESYLDTKVWPDPDLLIRTSGEMRISNFLIWQMAYSELYFTEVLWPEFLPIHLKEAIRAFQKRSRRKGK